MSLDVYLEGKTETVKCMCCECFDEHTRQSTEEFYSANITHNLGAMAGEAGIYEACWRPEEIGATKAKDIIDRLQTGLALMEADPERFKKHNSQNGWGLYENFVPWVRRYLEACEQHPEATIRVWR